MNRRGRILQTLSGSGANREGDLAVRRDEQIAPQSTSASQQAQEQVRPGRGRAGLIIQRQGVARQQQQGASTTKNDADQSSPPKLRPQPVLATGSCPTSGGGDAH